MFSQIENFYLREGRPYIVCVSHFGEGRCVGGIHATAVVLNYARIEQAGMCIDSILEEDSAVIMRQDYTVSAEALNIYGDDIFGVQEARVKAVEKLFWKLFQETKVPHALLAEKEPLREVITDPVDDTFEYLLSELPINTLKLGRLDISDYKTCAQKPANVVGLFYANQKAYESYVAELESINQRFPEYQVLKNSKKPNKAYIKSLNTLGLLKDHRIYVKGLKTIARRAIAKSTGSKLNSADNTSIIMYNLLNKRCL